MSAVPNAWGFSLFCDDIRHELGGKTTIVGIYQIDMIYPPEVVFPLVIPKFGIFVKYYETPGALKNDLNLRVYFPGLEKDKPVVDIPILRATLNPDAAPQYPLEDDQQRVFNLSFPLLLGPIPI